VSRRPQGGVHLVDGPAADARLALHRAPVYLRVVIDRESGAIDALDQLDDTPRDGEAVHVYQADPSTLFALRGDIIVCVRGEHGGLTRAATAQGEYHHLADVDGEQLRGTKAWREWVLERVRTVEGREPVLPTSESERAGTGYQP
jgi:hypothetical protein